MVCFDFYSRYDILKNDRLIKAINCSVEVVLDLEGPASPCKATPASKHQALC